MPDLNGRPDQWFLDLDGVRSGPYQTPEVLSLIAEGEVLPHHRISVGLKDAEWSSVLDWRMALSRGPEPLPPIRQPRFEVPIPETEATVSEVLEVTTSFKDSSLDSAQEKTPPPKISTPTLEKVPPKNSFVHKEEVSVAPPVKNAPEKTDSPNASPLDLPPPEAVPAPKRDPMAEMFDVLQSTKQRREAKSQAAVQIQNQIGVEKVTARAEQAAASKNGSMGKTLGIGALIVLGGFVLGQVFQNASPPKTTAANPKPAFTPIPEGTPASTPETEVVDRSNDKMIIRGRVEKRPEAKVHAVAPPTAKANPKDYKEAEELNQLKQELLELKAMKNYPINGNGDDNGADPENVNNAPGNPEMDDPNFPQNPNDTRMVNPNYNNDHGDPNNGGIQPNPNQYGAPNSGQPANPRGGATNPNSNVHY
jgi:hypothetical protein